MNKKDVLDLIRSLPDDEVRVTYNCYIGGINLMVNAQLSHEVADGLRGHFIDCDGIEQRLWLGR